MNRLLRIVGGIATLLIVVAFAAAITVAVVPRLTNWTTVVVLSATMEPAIPAGSLALVEPVEPDAIKAGDIVAFEIPGQPRAVVSRRVESVLPHADGPVLITKADASVAPDTWRVPAASVTGRVAGTIPWMGAAAEALRAQPDLLMLILLPVALFVLSGLGSTLYAARQARRSSTETWRFRAIEPSAGAVVMGTPAEQEINPSGDGLR